MNNARYIAAKAVAKVTNEGAYSNLLLNSMLKEANLSKEDKALCTTIFYGTLDRMVTIDYYLKSLIKTPLKKVKSLTLAVLRTAVFQIKYLDKIPASAAVNEAVKIIKASKESFNASFVNGVLRSLLRIEIALPDDDTAEGISVRYSCPLWITEILLEGYGSEFTKEFLEDALKIPPVFIRVNTKKTDKQKLTELFEKKNIQATLTDCDDALLVEGLTAPEETDVYENGLFFVQDISCQKAVSMLGIKEDSLVLDMCAAPGGKSFLAALLAKRGRVVSCDLHEHRVGLINKGADRLGIDNISAKCLDATVFDNTLGLFDRIICDVPCSGLGVIRRKPDIKYKPQDSFEELIRIQRSILFNADKYLKQGGKILYSTCTLNNKENSENVRDFLKNHKNYTLEAEKTFSSKDGGDGFYSAVLLKM